MDEPGTANRRMPAQRKETSPNLRWGYRRSQCCCKTLWKPNFTRPCPISSMPITWATSVCHPELSAAGERSRRTRVPQRRNGLTGSFLWARETLRLREISPHSHRPGNPNKLESPLERSQMELMFSGFARPSRKRTSQPTTDCVSIGTDDHFAPIHPMTRSPIPPTPSALASILPSASSARPGCAQWRRPTAAVFPGCALFVPERRVLC
jgi:hypothetical protein